MKSKLKMSVTVLTKWENFDFEKQKMIENLPIPETESTMETECDICYMNIKKNGEYNL